MQLVTRLLLRLFVIGLFMLMVAAVFNLYAARQDIADEVRGSQSIGQLITTLSELQGSASVDPQIAAIDELNRSERLRDLIQLPRTGGSNMRGVVACLDTGDAGENIRQRRKCDTQCDPDRNNQRQSKRTKQCQLQ